MPVGKELNCEQRQIVMKETAIRISFRFPFVTISALQQGVTFRKNVCFTACYTIFKDVTPIKKNSKNICTKNGKGIILRTENLLELLIMKQFVLLLIMISACAVCNAQRSGSSMPGSYVVMSNGTEVSAKCSLNDNVLEVQVEGNNDYLEVFIIKDGEVEDYDVTIMTDDTLTFTLSGSENDEYTVYLRTNDDEDCINIDAKKE